MILTIDCGNTHITVGCVSEGGEVHTSFRIPTDKRETEYGYAAKLSQILALQSTDASDFDGAVISSVVPTLTDVLVRAVRLMTGKNALVVGAGVKTGLHICINDPGTVASDLVAAAVAAKESYPLPCIIVDMGTATTLTVVDEKSRYIGGAILPGVGLSLGALAEGTALLPDVDLHAPRSAIAVNTVESMRSGIVYGTAGSVDGLIDRFEAELGHPAATVVATGGIAPVIAPHCKHDMILDEDLLLKGLWIIWQKNQK